jgi:hypothetical protein
LWGLAYDDHFFVDLVFYNRLLRCYVLIDLKIRKLNLRRAVVEVRLSRAGRRRPRI